MDKAGLALAGLIKSKTNKGNVLFLCGKGNNGGDGITAARFLGDNYLKRVVVFGNKENLSEASKNALSKYKEPVIFTPELSQLKEFIDNADLIIDCLFGFNFRGSINGSLADVVKLVNESKKTVISADIPSGVDASTGKVEGPVIKASDTITFSCAKLGHFLPPGSFNKGKLKVADIGIRLPDGSINTFFTDIKTARKLLPQRLPQMHKKTAGSVLVIAGSKEYTGAAIMATFSAVLRAGAGYVTVATPDTVSETVQRKVIEPIVKAMPSSNGSLSIKALDELLNLAEQNKIILIGPGLSGQPESVELVSKFIDRCEKPLIIDADAINSLAAKGDFNLNENMLLTPHSGEFGRLIKKQSKEIEENRYLESLRFVNEYKTNLLLKGPNTVTTNGKTTYFNTTGNSGLASAGSGDILSGLIAGFASQGISLFKSAVLGAYVHGLAADLAVKELTEYSLIATDLLCWIPRAIKRILDSER
jgi:hydroxyethylthiazole kinase-like uncharacterized protein yjeF